MTKTNNTIPTENLILYDWLSFTSKIDSPESIMELLGLDHVAWEKLERGRNGYRQRFFFENISIMFDGTDEMGVFVDMSGKGCRVFESYSTTSWEVLLRTLYYGEEDYHITRLDMAFDDHTGILDIDTIANDTFGLAFVSKARKSHVHFSHDQDTDLTGITVDVGSEQSNMFIRIYDKAVEQVVKSHDCPDVLPHWIRVEMQMRDEIATGFVGGLMVNSVGDQFRGVLHNYLRYVIPDSDKNKSRWDMTPYWAELLEGVQAIRVWSAPGVDYTIWNLSNYVINQAGNALDCYLKIFGLEDLIVQLGNRAVKMSPKYIRLLKKYQRLKEAFDDE